MMVIFMNVQVDLYVNVNGLLRLDPLLPFSRIPVSVEFCQALIQASQDPSTRCIPTGNCTGLNCDLDSANITNNDLAFAVDKCYDPVLVYFTIYHGGVSTVTLNRSDTVFLGGAGYLSVEISRNASDLNLLVSGPSTVIEFVIVSKASPIYCIQTGCGNM